MSHADFELAGGGTLGRNHRTSFHNYQDSYVIQRHRECTIAVVTDGCSSGSSPGSSHNEVGAILGATLYIEALQDAVINPPSATPENIFDIAIRRMLVEIDSLVQGMGGIYKRKIQDLFLFTITGALLTQEAAYFFAFGDGIVFVNGKHFAAGPYNNTPPYPAYLLLGDGELGVAASTLDLSMTLLEVMPIEFLDHFLIGSDGVNDVVVAEEKKLPGLDGHVKPLADFWEADRYYNGNPDLVSRKLRLMSRDWPKQQPEAGLLPDDTTLIVGRRKQ